MWFTTEPKCISKVVNCDFDFFSKRQPLNTEPAFLLKTQQTSAKRRMPGKDDYPAG
ncbi:hypothetical protein BB560_001989, partial [Smittium megazygosporum]